MKHTAKHLFQSCVSLLLVLCLVASLPMTALAADSTSGPATSGVADVNGDGIITYVSFGDSVTNGYGMEGYRFDDGTNVYGFRREPAASYPALIRDELTEMGYSVKLEQMAISGFRMDELHWMLCDDYVADSYHDDFFRTWNRNVVNKLRAKDPEFAAKYSYDGTVENANRIIMTEYRNAVKNADLITIDLGTNNFGTFVTNTIQEILGLKELDYEVDFTQYVDANTAASLEAMLGQMIANMVGASSGPSYDLAMTLARCLMYGYLGFTEHYDGAIDAIYELNPNAKVVVIDCYTMITGVDLAGGALGEKIDLDQLYDMFITLSNFYTRELSPYANKVTHATMDGAPELFIDYYKDYPDANYPDSQFMHPSAERLMNEFIMENMGYDPDDPADREKFNRNILSSIQLLDGYVNNLTATIQSEVIDKQITPVLNETVADVESKLDITIQAIDLIYTAVNGVATAEGLLPTALEGVTAARDAVDAAIEGVATAENAVDTAVSGVSLAQTIMDLLIENLITGEYSRYFSGSKTNNMFKGIIIGKIEDYITDEIMIQAGFPATSANKEALANEAYKMACIYYDTTHSGGSHEEAYRLAILEGLRFMLVNTQNMSDAEAQATAEMAWQLNTIKNEQGYDAAVLAALQTQVDADTAAMAMQLNAVYEAYGYNAAVKAALTTQVDEATADLALAMVAAYEAAIAAGDSETDAEAAAVKTAVAASLSEENMAALSGFGIPDRETAADLVYIVAKMYQEVYTATGSDKEAVVYCLVEIAKLVGMDIDNATASTGYDLYTLVYKPALESGKSADEAKALAVVAAIATQYPQPEGLAEAIYAVYKGTATAEQQYLAYCSLMVAAGIPSDVATSICTCYTANLDGQYNNEHVKTTMIFFMTQALGMTTSEAAGNYASYLQYKNLPTTLHKIALVDTIYFDALLVAASKGLDLSATAEKFMAGTLKLDKPAADASEAEWAQYKEDSALASLFFRFMSQDGIYTHPSEEGQYTLYQAASAVLNKLLTPEADREISVQNDTNVLVLGDFIAANEQSYVNALAGNVTNLSNPDFRINEIRALLDSSYARDEYAQTFLPTDSADYVNAVKSNDVIILNLGSMNMGMIAKQLALYMSTGDTYSMEFSDLDNMKTHSLGMTMDGFLSNFSGAFGTDAVGALMLAFESYGYGYTTFADCLDNTVETIQALNPQADILLVGMYDLLGDAYIHEPNTGMYLEMGHFVGHAVNLMNRHMEIYAEMTDNVTYVDVTGTETNVQGKVNMMAGGVAGITGAFASATPTAEGYAHMADTINAAMGYTGAKKVATGWSGATQWTLTEDGVLTVYGEGNMKDYGWNGGQPWLNKGVEITSVVVEEGVTSIGTGAFKDLTTLESVTLPETGLTKIGEAAFYGCSSLKELHIPDGVYTIWEYVFKNCTALEKIRLPRTLEKIDQGAFENCSALSYVFFPGNLKIIGGWSFKACSALTEIDMQWVDATEIRAGAFKNCTALTNIILPANIQVLGESCFYGIGAEKFVVPATVTEIQPWCFARSSVKQIVFEGNAPVIGEGAFNTITLTASYPDGNATWTDDVMQNYGGTVTWTAK